MADPLSPTPNPVCHVWNVTQGYVEHIGRRNDCVAWLRNVKSNALSRDAFQIKLGRPGR